MNESVKEFIVDLLNGNGYLDDEYNKEDIDKIRTIDFGIEDDWELWANGLDNGIFFRTENEELCELV